MIPFDPCTSSGGMSGRMNRDEGCRQTASFLVHSPYMVNKIVEVMNQG
jgi:hypothetical protein